MIERETTASAPTLEDARGILRTFFSYEDFRPGQGEIIASILAGRDTVAVMPTGGGKSLCYQVPALMLEGLTVVVSPLIALMQDQVDALSRRGIPATYINSHLTHRDVTIRMERTRFGAYRMLYVAPERFESSRFVDALKGIPISLLAVDEAHCVSEWGHDFRPSYLRLAEAREQLGRPVVAALTATATPEVRRDIVQQLALTDPVVLVRGFDRPNLRFRVLTGVNKKQVILDRCARGDSGVVYAGSRATVEELARLTREAGIASAPYHAGLGADQRRETQEQFLSGTLPVIVATTAFGMGIDKPNVRFVIHHDMPLSIEQYYQEAGRAGRDGEPAECIVLYHEADRGFPELLIRSTYPDRALVQQVYSFLHNEAGTVVGNYTDLLLPLTASSIANRLRSASETSVRNALGLLEHHGYLRQISTVYARTTLRFLLPPERMREWVTESTRPLLTPVVFALLRTVGGEAFFSEVDVDIADIAAKSFLDEERILDGLRELAKEQVVALHLERPKSGIVLSGVRIPAGDLDIDFRAQDKRRKRQFLKLDALEHYLTASECRRNLLLAYFSEDDIKGTCGICDVCTGESHPTRMREQPLPTREDRLVILHAVAEVNGKFGRSLVVDILRGAKTRRIVDYGLTECAMYGRLASHSGDQVKSWLDVLVVEGLLRRSDGVHPTLFVTQEGEQFLGRPVLPRSLPARGAAPEEAGVDAVLLEALRAVRRRVAQHGGLPSYAVMTDEVLRALCLAKPRDRGAFLAIEGVGPATFQKCGREMLAAITDHETQRHLTVALEKAGAILEEISPTVRETLALAEAGLDLASLAERRGLSIGTVSQHLVDLIEHGIALPLDSLVPPVHQQEIRRASRSLHSRDLKRIKSVVDPAITFAEIRLLLAWIAKESAKGEPSGTE